MKEDKALKAIGLLIEECRKKIEIFGNSKSGDQITMYRYRVQIDYYKRFISELEKIIKA